MKYTLSILVENIPGVLSKVTGLFSRRNFNIDSLSVGVTENDAFSRITIVVDGDSHTLEQVEKQLNKLINVIKVRNLTGSALSSELSLIKVTAKSSNRGEILSICNMMGAKILSADNSTISLSYSGSSEQTKTLKSLLTPYGIKDSVYTGQTCLE